MKHLTKNPLAACLAATLPALAHAVTVYIEVTGVVDFSVIAGSLVGLRPGDLVAMGFNVNSDIFVNSASVPTRGYSIDLRSFSMTVAGRPVPTDMPQPSGTADFFALSVHVPGLTPTHELDLHATYNRTTRLRV